MPYNLLITGSRHATQLMRTQAARAVVRAQANGWHIVVGDAEGVDSHVVIACIQFDVPFTCYGISHEPRLPNCLAHYDVALLHYQRVGHDYLDRDRYMCNVAQRCYAIWDGSSRGTRYTFEYARSLGLQTDVANFGEHLNGHRVR